MDKPRFAHKVCDRESLSVVHIAIAVFMMVWGVTTAQSAPVKQDSMSPVVNYLIKVGTQQYKRAVFARVNSVERPNVRYVMDTKPWRASRPCLHLADCCRSRHSSGALTAEGPEPTHFCWRN